MADFAIGGGFHKANRSLLRIVPLKLPCRYFATRDSSGFITLPVLDTGDQYLEVQAVRQASFNIDDQEKEFRLIGDDGWSDSVTIGSKLSAQMETFFQRNTEVAAGTVCPTFLGDYSEDFAQIEKSRYDKDTEVYFELLKEMGRSGGSTGNFIYDFVGFNGVIRNYKETPNPEDLTNISFQVLSRGRPVFGRYDAGAVALTTGAVFSSVLPTFNATLTTGVRRYGVVPVDNASAIVVSSPLTVTYTSNGSIALANMALGQPDGSGFVLEVASTGVRVPCTVALGGGGFNVVTITPTASLAAATVYKLTARNGAVNQSVDASNNASSTGFKKPFQGFSITFRTA